MAGIEEDRCPRHDKRRVTTWDERLTPLSMFSLRWFRWLHIARSLFRVIVVISLFPGLPLCTISSGLCGCIILLSLLCIAYLRFLTSPLYSYSYPYPRLYLHLPLLYLVSVAYAFIMFARISQAGGKTLRMRTSHESSVAVGGVDTIHANDQPPRYDVARTKARARTPME